MRHPFKTLAVAAALLGAAISIAAPAVAARPAGMRSAPHGEVRPAPYWRWANGCRGGRYYRYLGGWGCDYDAYSGYSGRRR